MTTLIAYGCGLLFGAGLIVSGMINPARVVGFLDVTGNWDPSLLFVMAGAVLVASLGFALASKRKKPVCADTFEGKRRNDWDKTLLIGAALFGAGWGLSGICPGPAWTALASAQSGIFQFMVAMLIGVAIYEKWGGQ